MWKAKGRLVSLLSACLAALLTLVLGVATMNVQPKMASAADGTWTLVTDASTLAAGDEIVIAATDYNYALSTTQNGNNRGQAAVTKDNTNDTITFGDDVQVLTVEAGTTNGTFALSTGEGYLYAASSSKNYLRTETKLSANSSWKITVAANGIATIEAQGSNTRKTMQYNQSSSIFSCYGSASQKAICLYKLTESSDGGCEHAYQEEITQNANCTEKGEKTYTCSLCGDSYTEEIDALGHNEEEKEITQPATCTEAGSKIVRCTVCGEEREKVIPALGHSYVDGACSVCGEKQPTSCTLTFDDVAKRTEFSTEKQVWEENGITVTNNKENGSDIADYSNPVRFYKNSQIIVAFVGMVKIEFTCNGEGYATELKNSIGDTATATVNGNVVTVAFAEAQDEFIIDSLSAQVRMNSLTVIAEGSETPEQPVCEHTNTTTTTVDATCTEAGSITVTCDDCGEMLSTEKIDALGHNYVDNFCEICGVQDPATIDYSGYYYISFTHSETVYYADNSELNSNRYYAKTEQPSVEPVEAKYVYRLVKTGMHEQLGVYSLYEVDGYCYQENVIVEKVGDVYHFYATVGEDEYQFLLNAGSSTKYIKFYKKSNATQSNYAQDLTLTPVEVASIKSASVTISDNIEVNYYATIADVFVGDVVMQYTVGDEGVVYDTEGVREDDGRYKFTFKLPPQYMADVIDLKIVYDDFVLDSMEYSVKTYAQNQLNNDPSDKLKQLLTDMLYYGAAAQKYVAMQKGITVEEANLATNGVENLGTASTATPDSTDFTLVKNEAIDNYPAYFTGATVWFDNVNRIRVKINTTEGVTLTINGEAVEVKSTTIDTKGILATQFAETYTFVLSHNGVVMQTLTYSINAYAYAKKDDAKMSELALALYNYGISAKAYAPYAN